MNGYRSFPFPSFISLEMRRLHRQIEVNKLLSRVLPLRTPACKFERAFFDDKLDGQTGLRAIDCVGRSPSSLGPVNGGITTRTLQVVVNEAYYHISLGGGVLMALIIIAHPLTHPVRGLVQCRESSNTCYTEYV